MLVVTNVFTSEMWSKGQYVKPIDYHDDVVVVIDPSKTNMACWIFTYYGEPVQLVEFSGNNRTAGPVMDTTEYLADVRSYLTQLLSNCNVAYAAIEAAITKKGMEHHHSSMVLNEIRGALLNFFLETYNIRADEINNWSWKAGVLPDGYRSRKEKGSKRWICDTAPNSMLAQCYAADATDAYCIGLYVLSRLPKKPIKCTHTVEDEVSYTYSFYPKGTVATVKERDVLEFIYNPNFSFEDNMKFFVSTYRGLGYALVPLAAISIKHVVGHSHNFTAVPHCNEVEVCVCSSSAS